MLRLTLTDECLQYDNGFYAGHPTVTRYAGERWEQIPSDLLCGIADVFEDVGIVFIGKSPVPSVLLERAIAAVDKTEPHWEHTSGGWLAPGIENTHKSIYAISDDGNALYVPNSREAVEECLCWIFWEDFRGIAFSGYRAFRERLLSTAWIIDNGDLASFVTTTCVSPALFQIKWAPGSWRLFPGAVKTESLVRLADPVVARINTELTD